MFDHCHGQCAIWLKLYDPATCLRNLGAETSRHVVLVSDTVCRGRVLVVVLLAEVGRGFWLGLVRIWFALLARCAALFACLVCCFVLAFGCLCPCWVSLPCYNWHPVWFVFVPAGGNRFALGTGGIRWSLLVGGLGPVLSIPKLCFKPFRRLSAVGFVLGWHREPLLITPPQVP